MKFLGAYKELCPTKDYPSMKDYLLDAAYDGKDRIVNYLRHGNEDMCRMEVAKDVFTGEIIGTEIGMNDGEYTWFDTLAYYVEKYNLKLPYDFEKKVLRD